MAERERQRDLRVCAHRAIQAGASAHGGTAPIAADEQRRIEPAAIVELRYDAMAGAPEPHEPGGCDDLDARTLQGQLQ